MSVSRSEILDLLEASVQGSGLIGGVRRRRPGRPRKRRVLGRGEEPLVKMIEEVVDDRMYGDGLIGGLYGEGVIGGARKRRRKGTKKMSEATKRYLAEYRRMHPRRKRKARGRGEYGGSTAQDLYDQAIADGKDVKAVFDKYKDVLQSGAVPKKRKEQKIESIRTLEKKYGMNASDRNKLREYTNAALDDILKYLRTPDLQAAFKYPPIRERRADYVGEPEDDYDF